MQKKKTLFYHYLGFLILLFAFECLYSQNAKEKSKQPNIIFILTDDLGYGDLGAFFQKQRELANNRNEPWELTPHLDKMAEEGAMLTQHYCAAPVCAPSRSSLLSGVSQGHSNVRDNQFDKALEDNYTLGNVLQKAGYATAAIGKWGLQGLEKGPDWPAHPLNRGFDYYFGYMRHSDGHEHYPKEGIYRGKKEVWENRKEISDQLDKCYTGDLWTAAAKKWILEHEQSKNAHQPFFMYLAYDLPHAVLELPTQSYPSGGGLRGGVQWLGKNGQMINTAIGQPDSWVDPEYANATYDNDNNPSTSEVAWPDTYKRYATIISRIDNEVGDILQLLQDLKIDSNTLVIFTSDNGPSIESYLPKGFAPNHPDFFKSFGPFDGIKRDCWEGGLRVPTIAYWPTHIQAKSMVAVPSISYDWMPTFTDLAGLSAPARTDGVSLLPSLTGKGTQRKSNIYVEYFEEGQTPNFKSFSPSHRNRKRNQMQMLRIGDTVGVRYNIKSGDDDFEIYDIVTDPEETQNLANDNKDIAQLQKKMKEKVLQMRRPDSSAPRPYDEVMVPSLESNKKVQGLRCKIYNGDFPWLPDLSVLNPIEVVDTDKFSFPKSKNKDGNIYLLEGYIEIPKDGTYTFYMSADGKAFMRLHDATIIDEDFNYIPGTEKEASINLKAGLHPFKVSYMKDASAKKPGLNLKWSGEGMEKGIIGKKILFRD